VRQHVWGEVGYLMTALLQISRWMWQWKNFENRTVFDEVICRLRWLTFFGQPCRWLCKSFAANGFLKVRTSRCTSTWHQWLKYGGTQFPHLQFLFQSVPPPQISRKRRETLKRTLRYADIRILAYHAVICDHTVDAVATQVNSCVTSAVCIGLNVT